MSWLLGYARACRDVMYDSICVHIGTRTYTYHDHGKQQTLLLDACTYVRTCINAFGCSYALALASEVVFI